MRDVEKEGEGEREGEKQVYDNGTGALLACRLTWPM